MDSNILKFMPKNYRGSRKAPYLGKIRLNWCPTDQIPILEKSKCPSCGSKTFRIEITPPGDVRPAFEKELKRFREIVDADYGLGLGHLLLPENKIYLLNKIPGLDSTEEIIFDGDIYGVFQYDPFRQKSIFKPKTAGAQRIINLAISHGIELKKRIEISDDSLSFILAGKSILAPGIIDFSNDIEKGDQCIVMNNDRYVTVAISHADSAEIRTMVKSKYGKVGKNLKKQINKGLNNDFLPGNVGNTLDENNKGIPDWQFVFEVNKGHMHKIVDEAKNFIVNTIQNQNKAKKVAVAYSGGKDSLCVLLLAYETLGPNFKIFFADTGLELPEVLQNTKDVVKILKMEDLLFIKNAGDKFWDLIEDFGPPSRDYRFCCHTLKAQQIMDLIQNLGDGEKILSFLGQRRYESFSRSAEKRVYINSFIPLQIAATPIKNWNALEVWLFILYYPHFVEEKRVNIPATPLYFEGFERLGCYLCPASSLFSLNLLKKIHPELIERWDKWLKYYSKKMGYPEEWIKFGLWRFKQMNNMWRDIFKKRGIKYDLSLTNRNLPLEIALTQGFSPCVRGGFSLKGKFNTALDLDLITPIVNIISGESELYDDMGVLTIKNDTYLINIFTDGSFYIRVKSKDYKYDNLVKKIVGIVAKSHRCNACGVCEKICPEKVMILEKDENDNLRPIIPEKLKSKCSHCGKCISHCPIFQKIKDTL